MNLFGALRSTLTAISSRLRIARRRCAEDAIGTGFHGYPAILPNRGGGASPVTLGGDAGLSRVCEGRSADSSVRSAEQHRDVLLHVEHGVPHLRERLELKHQQPQRLM